MTYDPRDPEQRAELVRALDDARGRLLASAVARWQDARGGHVQLQLGQVVETGGTE